MVSQLLICYPHISLFKGTMRQGSVVTKIRYGRSGVRILETGSGLSQPTNQSVRGAFCPGVRRPK